MEDAITPASFARDALARIAAKIESDARVKVKKMLDLDGQARGGVGPAEVLIDRRRGEVASVERIGGGA